MTQIIGMVVEVDGIQISGVVVVVVVILMDGVVVDQDCHLGEVMAIVDEMMIGKDQIKSDGDEMIILNGKNNRNHGNEVDQ